ncbi:MAG: geranylgeranylglyceryl/heptaprenylglyceryl phosphate synthase [Flavobacteriales bacterium]|nr:geranylgeranylglyceryl/heptaprenylglyceryl phosphate synthase [Flavobacteriales bacterium]
MSKDIYHNITLKVKQEKKLFAVLIDPDKQNFAELLKTIHVCNKVKIDFFLVGGSIITNGNIDNTVHAIKENSTIPVVLFPGNHNHISTKADGILFLSLISGRNPDFLIGNQLLATPKLKTSKLEIIPTGYLLVDCGNLTTAIKVSETPPIAYNNNEQAANTALTGQYLGQKLIYIDGGSGAQQPISNEMISLTKSNLDIPLIIGGGIKSAKAAAEVYKAGADIIVIGNGAEKNRNLIEEISTVRNNFN